MDKQKKLNKHDRSLYIIVLYLIFIVRILYVYDIYNMICFTGSPHTFTVTYNIVAHTDTTYCLDISSTAVHINTCWYRSLTLVYEKNFTPDPPSSVSISACWRRSNTRNALVSTPSSIPLRSPLSLAIS